MKYHAASRSRSKSKFDLAHEPVILEEHRSDWEMLYTREARRISASLGAALVQLAHVGSTSVPGIRAKPIIDVAAGMRSTNFACISRCILAPVGYDIVIMEREEWLVLRKVTECITYHLHIVLHGGPVWMSMVGYRDFLQRDRNAAIAYERLKTYLSVTPGIERSVYARRKGLLIDELFGTLAFEPS
jgi:GrpB-like predicted nucleotidyltransferase (UPF0157 family)